jgi:hypothetical protein
VDPLTPADRTRSPGDDLDGRTFAASAVSGPGDVDDRTRFRYRQDGDVVWADYAGGTVVRGHLVGLRRGSRLDFRYVHLDTDGQTAAGRCATTVERVGDRLRLHEEWHWESRPGSGTSVLDEIDPG